MKKTGSVFWHGVTRFNRMLYQLLYVSPIGRLFTSYESWQKRVCEDGVFVSRKRKSRRYKYKARRALACAMQDNIFTRLLRRGRSSLCFASLRSYGVFLTVLGVLLGALYALSFTTALAGLATWQHLIVGAVLLLPGILLLFSDRSLGSVLSESSLLSLLLFKLLGLSEDAAHSAPRRGKMYYFKAILPAFICMLLSLVVEPLVLVAVAGSLLLIMLILHAPETGVLLTLAALPFSKLLTGSDILTVLLLTTSLFGYFGKLLRGNRTLHLELQDMPLLVLFPMLLLSLFTVTGGFVWLTVLQRTVLACAYFMVINVMAAPFWYERSRIAFVFFATAAALVGVIRMLVGVIFTAGAGISDFPTFSHLVNVGFQSKEAFALYLVVAIALLVPMSLRVKRRYRILCLMSAVILVSAAVLTFVPVARMAILAELVIFFLVYERNSFPFVALGSGALGVTWLLLPDTAKSVLRGVLGGSASLQTDGSAMLRQTFFSVGDGFFSRRSGILRLVFGAGCDAPKTLYPYFATSGAEFSFAAFHSWQYLLLEYGVFGVIVPVLFAFFVLQNCFSVISLEKRTAPLAAFSGIMLVFAVAIFFSFSYVLYDLAALAALLLAAALVGAELRYARHRSFDLPKEEGVMAAEIEYREGRRPRVRGGAAHG